MLDEIKAMHAELTVIFYDINCLLSHRDNYCRSGGVQGLN